ncbi:SURP and G-patch domain-containing protein 1-like protein [Dinothrombium tinctorium]|uniref:SURP and G-patch domain-containing protein 1-like protein n=1 Tax=Dinothrombium tinctorium TaxID=1965070 RepID=A0A3S3QIB7_9ACAR|nr:SURP and G-patch domain-containing protein 1-like protein [Dinothrombium tinctorium]RWS09842.1 SURP and G-patch domain-containing protein 1-like protein [Dinothrombium tinctorium]RWS10038.1 SURP and G-patch domain-containing protein 1-like protein [Dinothrombium tinctorium]
MNGPKAEDLMKESTNNNINYSWLKDTESYNYKYFLRRVEELKSAKRRAEDEEVKGTSSEDKFVINLLPNTESDQSNEGGEKNNTKKRQRKSRWGDRSETYVPQDVGLIQYAIQVFGKTDLSPEQWKQLEDQRKMRILCEMMQAKQKHLQTLQNAGKVKYEYDSDEEIEGGTWEHKRRLQEMETTSKWAEMLTEHSKGKHHLGDFLPTEELEKFMQQWEAIKDKKASLLYESDYQNFKLQSDNVGYQLLKKMGWNEGESVAGIGNAGLGHVRPHELKDGDDEYDAYRKRMMLAYRFRPNPLNNPRRAYY